MFCAEGPRAALHMQCALSNWPHSDPPSGPRTTQARWTATASATQHPRRKTIGCQTCKMVRKWASARWGHAWNAGGREVAGGGFTLKIASTPIVSVTSTCSARAKSDPPQPHQAPRRAQRSPLCERGDAKVSGDPRTGVWGGARNAWGQAKERPAAKAPWDGRLHRDIRSTKTFAERRSWQCNRWFQNAAEVCLRGPG